MPSWIFQGNPKRFDIDDYVARYPELIYWRTPRYAKHISIGDRVFIWRSGPSAGVVAIGHVAEQPIPGSKVLHPEALGSDLWRTDAPDPEEPRTGIHIDEFRLSKDDGYVTRIAVSKDHDLYNAPIITARIGTVFPLDNSQTRALEALWGCSAASASTNEPFAVTEGKRRLQAHYKRERGTYLRAKKLAEVRAKHGQCACAICGINENTGYPPALALRIFEVHHLAPLAKAVEPVRTTLADLAILCANCHRAVHANSDVESNTLTLGAHFLKSS